MYLNFVFDSLKKYPILFFFFVKPPVIQKTQNLQNNQQQIDIKAFFLIRDKNLYTFLFRI